MQFFQLYMLDEEDLKWIASNLTQLNRLLQQVARHGDQARKQKENSKYLQLLGEEVDQAGRIAQAVFDRITLQIHAAVAKGRGGRRGSQFTVLPPPSSAAQALSDKSATETIALPTPAALGLTIKNPQGHGPLILVVDDDAEVLERASAMLEVEDFRVVTAKDGFEALKIYRALGGEISLIILDFFLPVMDGDAVFDELKAINPSVQVVLSSGFAEQTKLSSMLARGLRGFIPKPYTSAKLLDQVRSVIAA